MISPDNKHGEKISLLLISKAGAEGLDLKYIRHLHILNPFWNYGRILQIIARGSRYKSHVDLPDAEQNIQSYVYLSTYPKDFEPSENQELTTDVELYMRSMKNHKLINEGLLVLAEASIDCNAFAATSSNPKIHCLKCMPTGQPLYQKTIAKDLLVSNPCVEPVSEKVVAHEIEYAGTKYYYQIHKSNKKKIPDFSIYEYNKDMDAYTSLDKSNPIHADIMRQLINLTS